MLVTADASLRFVLPEDAPYLKNLSALWVVDPFLAAAIEGTDGRAPHTCEPSKSGLPTVYVTTPEGRKLYLHSRYEPMRDAESLVAPVEVEEKFVFFVLGFGLGYHVEKLIERASEESLICVMEPDLLMLRAAFEQRDYSNWIETGRIYFFTRQDKTELFIRLTSHQGLMSVGSEIIHHPPSTQLAPEFHRQMETWIGELRDYLRTGLNTLVLNGRKTAENITRNIGWYAASPDADRLRERYQGMPAIIVSAGPSLRKNKHHLKNAAGKSVIIAVQTMLKPLLEMGIEPQFVTSLDYHDISSRFFENLPRSVRTELIAEPKATAKIFSLNPGPLTLLGNDYADHLVHEMKLNRHRLRSGATVAHLAYYLAEYMGCDPIIFVGQDLGFSDGLCYSPGTSYEDVWRPELSEFYTMENKQWEQIVRDRQILRQIPDHLGRPMYTEERLFTYLQQFERDFSQARARIIDATEGGAFKRGAEMMPLARAIETFCSRELPAVPDDHPGLNFARIEPCVRSLEARYEEASQIEQIAIETLPLLEDLRNRLDDQAYVNKVIARVDVLRSRMDQYGRCYDLITQLTQFTELRRFEQDRKIAASRAQGIDRQRRQLNRDIDNVRSVIDAAKEFRTLIGQVIDHLRAEHGVRPGRKEAA